HLENRGSAGDRGRNRHEGHDLLLAPPGQSRQKTADGLNPVLRIARQPNDGLRYPRYSGATARRRGGHGCVAHERFRLTALMFVGSFAPTLAIPWAQDRLQSHTNIARLSVKRLS